MKIVRFIFVLAVVTGMIAAGKLIVGTRLSAQIVQTQTQTVPTTATDSPPFDFADAFYTENGINVATGAPFIQCVGDAGGRVGDCTGGFGFTGPFGPDGVNVNWVTDTSNTDPVRNSTRVLQTTGGFDRNGNLIYYSIMGTINDQTFFTTNTDGSLNAAGQRAMTLADQFRAFIMPKQVGSNGLGAQPCGPTNEASGTNGAQPCWVASPAPPNRRQDNLFATDSTYFCQNLLGLWRLVFVTFTSQAYNANGSFASSSAQAVLSPLGQLNGTSIDGTPVLDTEAEMDGLTGLGYAEESDMPSAPHAGAPRWVV